MPFQSLVRNKIYKYICILFKFYLNLYVFKKFANEIIRIFNPLYGLSVSDAEEYTFQKTLKQRIVKSNPELKLWLWTIDLKVNLTSNFEKLFGNDSDILIEHYKSEVKRLESQARRNFEKFKQKIIERDGENSELYNHLKNLSHKELIEYYLDFEDNNSYSLNHRLYYGDIDLRNYVRRSYQDYDKIKSYSRIISLLTRKYKKSNRQTSFFLEDRRSLFRKLISSHFKNSKNYSHNSILLSV